MLALRGGTVFRSAHEEPLRDAIVVIENGIVVDVAERAGESFEGEIIDCTSLNVAPSFWNSHVHFFERKYADASEIPADELALQLSDGFLRYGFTEVFDLGSGLANTKALRERIESGQVAGPRIRTTGPGIVPPGALPSDDVHRVMGVLRFEAPEVTNGDDARKAARRLISAGVDGIKVFASSPRSGPIDPGALRAAIAAAGDANLPSFVHPNNADDVLAATVAGATVIGHTTPLSGPWSDEIVAAMRGAGVSLTPTLALWRQFFRHDRASTAARVEETAIAQLRAWMEIGGEVLFGTDLGAVDCDPQPEYEMMALAGMNNADVLATLTVVPARRFRADRTVARIASGYAADIAVYGHSFSDVRVTLRDGRPIFRR